MNDEFSDQLMLSLHSTFNIPSVNRPQSTVHQQRTNNQVPSTKYQSKKNPAYAGL